jgi:sec-independent protein translocase protein TatB
MFNVGGGELLVILLIALMVLGPDRLPGFAKKAGKVLSEVRRVSHGFQSEIRQAMDFDGDADDRPKPITPPAGSNPPRLVEPPPPAGGPSIDRPVPPTSDGPGPASPATEPGGESTSGSSAA